MCNISYIENEQNNTYLDYEISSYYNSSFSNVSSITLIEAFKQNYPIKLWKYYGLFKEDFILRINEHWLKFPPPNARTHYFLGGLYIIIMTLGMLGNALVIFMISRCKSLRTPANILVMNLAVSDFLIMSEIPIFVFNSFHRGPVLGEQVCRYYGFIGGLSGTVAICTLTAISVDRYYVIKFPLNMRFTSLRAKICVAITWTYGIVFSVVPLLDIGLGTYVPEGYLTSCSYDYLTEDYNARLFIFVFCIAAWVFPFILIAYCYITILMVVNTQKKFKFKGTESVRHVKQEEKKKQEQKLAFIVFLVIGLWFAAWTPYTIVSLLGISGRKDLIQPFYSMIPALFCKLASCADPFVYAFTHPRFKDEIMKMFFKSSANRHAARKVWSTEQEARNEIIETVTVGKLMRQIEELHQKGLNVVVSENELKIKNTPFKKPWWYRPSFNDRYSSIRFMRRSFSRSSQKGEQEVEGGNDDCDRVFIE